MEYVSVGLLAHVDAGKTTLSEAMLYESGVIQTLGRVDKKSTFLDTYEMEKQRGITIFSKQAIISIGTKEYTLVDTPGHIDFSAEMERALQILDAAILVISGVEGVQSHTKTLWNLTSKYQIPTFIFINKMDRGVTSEEEILQQVKEVLGKECLSFVEQNNSFFMEEVATCNEVLLEQYLEDGTCQKNAVKEAISKRQIIPVLFGSALKNEGVREFITLLGEYTKEREMLSSFGASVFKIMRDEQGNKVTFLKMLGGILRSKELIEGEKVNQIRLYSGEKYTLVQEAFGGQICAIIGPQNLRIGMSLGDVKEQLPPPIEAALTYEIISEEDHILLVQKLKVIEEEEPSYHFTFDTDLKQIKVALMGEVQQEVLKELIFKRLGIVVSFGEGTVLYKETIEDVVEGVGHFEPLRHYAEVHLLLEPLAPGSGLVFEANCREEILGKQWQNLVLSHLKEKEHIGVLVGAPITDMKITLISGRAHLKHTEGGDFRQAVFRAIRQGLMEAKSKVLEPYIEYELEIQEHDIGRAMTDIKQKFGTMSEPKYRGKNVVLEGRMPYVFGMNYQKEVRAYTKGEGNFVTKNGGYFPCHNEEEVIEKIGYDVEADILNTPDSVFCAKGAGYVVPWFDVKKYMHIEERKEHNFLADTLKNQVRRKINLSIGTEEVDQILAQVSGANKREKSGFLPPKTVPKQTTNFEKVGSNRKLEKILVIDGYNMIFGCDKLQQMGQTSIDNGRSYLEDLAENYAAVSGTKVMVVYDAYKVIEGKEHQIQKANLQVIYTKEKQTADQFIEKFVHDNHKNYHIIVATSDGLEQTIVRGQGGYIMSVRECFEQMTQRKEEQLEQFQKDQNREKNYIEIENRSSK